MKEIKEEMKGNAMFAVGFILFVLFAIALIISWPLFIIFALNTLFASLSIPYTFWTWLSVCILNISSFGGISAAINRRKLFN